MSKKLYIYDYVDGITASWHDGGGLVIVTDGDPIEFWKTQNPKYDADFSESKVKVIDVPDSEENAIHIFPDQGCC